MAVDCDFSVVDVMCSILLADCSCLLLQLVSVCAVCTGTSIQLTCSNLYRMSVAFFPPSPEILSNMCRQGFDDALRYLQKNSKSAYILILF